MKISAALIILALSVTQASADQFDCIFKWASVAAAKSDASAMSHMANDDQGIKQFVADHVIPNLQVWRASQDTVDGQGNVVHTPLTGYFALISVDHRMPALESDPALQVCINRDKMNAGQTPYVFLSSFSAAILKDIRFSPIYMGANVPFGNLQ